MVPESVRHLFTEGQIVSRNGWYSIRVEKESSPWTCNKEGWQDLSLGSVLLMKQVNGCGFSGILLQGKVLR